MANLLSSTTVGGNAVITTDNIGTYAITSLSGYATQSYVNTQVSNLVDSAPGALNTLNELAAALGDDANFSTTVTNSIATKVPLSGSATITGFKTFATVVSSQDDWQNSPISILERDNIGTGSTSNTYAPNLNFHWSSRVSNSLWMNYLGDLHWGSYSGTGVPAVDGTFKAGTLYAGSGQITSTKVSNWDTAYSWGDHASAGYLTSLPSHTHSASDITSGILSTDRLPKQELGISIQGNFGQWMSHSTHSTNGFNDNPTYWGWTFIQGNTGAPHTSSSQWYRGRFSLGNGYGLGTGSGDYWMEIAIPRYNYSTTGNMYVRTNENGTTGSWSGIRAVYANDAGLLDGIDSGSFLRSDADDTFTGLLTGNRSAENLRVSGIRGQAKGSQTGEYIHLYERVHIGGPSGWGAASHGAPSNGLSVWGSVDFGMNGSGVIQLDGTTIVNASRQLVNVTNTNWDTAYGWGNHASAGYLTGITAGTGLSGGGTSGTPTISSVYLPAVDDRDVKPSTSGITASVKGIKPFFTSFNGMTGSSGGAYLDMLAFDTYSDSSAGGPSAITFHKGESEGNPKMYIWKAGWQGTTWGTGQRVFADNYHPNADKWTTARTLTLSGDVTGSVSWDGSANASITATVADDSHNHVISNVDGLQTALDGKLGTSAKAADSNLLDGLDSSSFFRSDAANSVNVRFAASNGRGVRFWDSENYKIWMSSSSDSSWGGRLDSTSDYNMYFRMSGGTNRGFVFQNSATEVMQIQSDGTILTANDGNSEQWNTAYGWGNHASAGYLTSVPNHSADLLTSGTLPQARLPEFIEEKYIYTSNDSNGVFMPMVKGGLLTSTSSSVTGAIKVTLPSYKSAMMFTIYVDIYEYTTGETVTLRVSGYAYSDTGATWHNCSVVNIADNTDRDYVVRFYSDTTNNKQYFTIGETNSTWAYPQVNLRDFYGGYSTSESEALGAWNVEFVTSFSGDLRHTFSGNFAASDWDSIRDKPSSFPPSAHSAALLTSGTLPIARIADDAITGAKIAHNTLDAIHINASAVGASELNVSGNGSSGQVLTSDGDGTFSWTNKTVNTDTNYYLDGITKSGNTLTFSVNGATNQTYTFGSNAFNSTTIPTNNNQLTNGAGYITSFDITTQTDPKYLRSNANDTMSGVLTITGNNGASKLRLEGTTPTIDLDDADGDSFYIHINSNNFYILADRDGGGNYGTWETPHPLQLEADTNIGYLFGSRMFADNYHPNADKWTTARTLSLAGDVTGSVSWDGSGNASITTVVADDSHNHIISNIDGLQSALDGKLSTSAKAADSNLLDGLDSSAFLRSNASDTMTGSLTIDNGANGSSTAVFNTYDRLIFNNQYSDAPRGPNKITLYDDNQWIAGLGIHNDTVAYYSGSTHKWYDSSSTTSFAQRMSLDSSGNLVVTGDITASGNQVITTGSNADVKFSVWSGTTYGIGMTSGVTYGGLNDYAMTFCMNNDSDRGFWWGYSGQSKSSGAMSLTTAGVLTVASSITAGGAVTGSNLNVSNWDTAYSWGDHAAGGYAPSSHTHVIADITSLQSTLDGKQAQGLLDRNGLITTNDWNSFYTDDTLRVVSAHNFTAGANNAPDNNYNYGAALTYRRTSNEAFQMYFPENNGNSTNGNRRVAFRTGWNGGWSSWRRFVDMIDNVGYVTGGNDTGFEVHSDVSYNQDPGTYFLLRGQADNNQPYALKILVTGNASGNDIEWRRLKMNGNDDRMYYAPEGQDQITFEYTVVTPSDARLKDNVKNISNPIEKLNKLNGCEFDWNSGVHEGKHDVGVIAQEVEAVIPEAVGEGSDGIKSVAYDKLVPLLIESVKEQQAMIQELKQEIQNLKNK